MPTTHCLAGTSAYRSESSIRPLFSQLRPLTCLDSACMIACYAQQANKSSGRNCGPLRYMGPIMKVGGKSHRTSIVIA